MRRALIGAGVGVLTAAVLAAALPARVVLLDGVAVAVMLAVCVPAGAVVAGLGGFVASRAGHPVAGAALAVLACLPVVWISGDLLYASLMRHGYERWEAGIERDGDGVREGCRAFTVGRGETALLLIHGFGDGPALYRRLAPALAERGFTCRAMRLPHFATPMDDYKRTSAAAWREAVGAELAGLARDHRRVVVVAHSLGGAVAVDYLADHPAAASGAVLMAPLLGVSGRRSPLLSPRGWFTLLDHTLLFTDRARSPFGPDLGDAEARSLMRTDEFIPRTVYRELFPLVERDRARAPDFRTPLLMLLAEDDPVIDNEAAERFFRACGAAPRRLERLTGTGHVLPMDARWRSVLEEIAEFAQGNHAGGR